MKVRNIVGYAILSAIVVILQLLSNLITPAGVSITLSLIPIVIGAIIYGPICGAFLGIVMGICVLCSPSTIAIFLTENAVGTFVVCLSKATIAGLVSGLIYKAFEAKNHSKLGIVIATLALPIINTGLFIGEAFIFFRNLIITGANGSSLFMYILTGYIGINFIIEFSVVSVLSVAVISIINIIKRKHV